MQMNTFYHFQFSKPYFGGAYRKREKKKRQKRVAETKPNYEQFIYRIISSIPLLIRCIYRKILAKKNYRRENRYSILCLIIQNMAEI